MPGMAAAAGNAASVTVADAHSVNELDAFGGIGRDGAGWLTRGGGQMVHSRASVDGGLYPVREDAVGFPTVLPAAGRRLRTSCDKTRNNDPIMA